MAPPTARKSKGRSSPRPGYSGIRGMAIRKPQAFTNRKTVFADRKQIDTLQKGLQLLNAGEEDGVPATPGRGRSEITSRKAPMKVAVRVRPLNSRESVGNAKEIIKVSGDNMLVFDPERQQDDFFYRNQKMKDVTARKYKNLKFAFDHVYDSSGTNHIIYEDIMKPLLNTLMSGFNCSVFAYGATGSGKTYTMLGSPENPGLTFLTINDLYERLDAMKEDYETQVVISYFEVYNEQVRDLLNSTGKQLIIMEVGNGIEIKDLSFHHPTDIHHLLEMLRCGNKCRSQHPTDHNAESSRSHAVLQVHIRMRERHKDMNSNSRTSKLVMVDLAGSEKGCATGFTGQRFREGSSINKSLLALGKVMEALASGKKTFSFRDSKLTRILKDSLGGNCRTVMIANISPAENLYEDTLNTLRYAQKAKKISCNASKNIISVQSCLSEYTRVVNEMTTKIKTLEKQLKEKDEDNERELNEKDARIQELEMRLAKSEEERNQDLNRINDLQTRLIETENKLKESERIQSKQQTTEYTPPNTTQPQLDLAQNKIADEPISQLVFVDEESEDKTYINYQLVPMPTILSVDELPVAKKLEEYLDCEKEFNIGIVHKLERIFGEFQLKFDQYEHLKSLSDSTADQRYEKAMKKATSKLEALANSLKSSMDVAKTHTETVGCKSVPQIFDSDDMECKISLRQLQKFQMCQALLKIEASKSKALQLQTGYLIKQGMRKEEHLKEFALVSNKMYNSLNHYGNLAPAIKEQYDKLVSSYCSPSLQFAENSKFVENYDCSFFNMKNETFCSNNESITMPTEPTDKRLAEVTNYLHSVKARLNLIYSRIGAGELSTVKLQLEELLEFTQISDWALESSMAAIYSTNLDVHTNYENLNEATNQILNGTVDLGSGEQNAEEDENWALPMDVEYREYLESNLQNIFTTTTPEMLANTDISDGFLLTDQDLCLPQLQLANETITLSAETDMTNCNDTFTLGQENVEKEVNENEDPQRHPGSRFGYTLPPSNSVIPDYFDIKTIKDTAAEFSERVGLKYKTPPMFESLLSSGGTKYGIYTSPRVSPTNPGPSQGVTSGFTSRRIPVSSSSQIPRSASPHRTYSSGIGAIKVSSAGKLPPKPRVLQNKSPSPHAAKVKKAAINHLRTIRPNQQFKQSVNCKTKTAQQQKASWQRPPVSKPKFGGGDR